jgi:hypothetical protein
MAAGGWQTNAPGTDLPLRGVRKMPRKIRAASSNACRAWKTGVRSIAPTMEVFAVTIFMSLAFAVLFAVLFLGERSQRKHRSIEQEALLPLDDGAPARPAPLSPIAEPFHPTP